MIHLFPLHECNLCLLNINKIPTGHIGSLGERCSIFDLKFWERGGYIQVVILFFRLDLTFFYFSSYLCFYTPCIECLEESTGQK